jgi:hypothetical protein
MAETLSLMEFLRALLDDAELRAAFGHDPRSTLADHGLADLTPADVHDALVLVQDNEIVAYSLDAVATAAPPPPPPPPAGDDHEAAVGYLQRYLDDPGAGAPDERWSDEQRFDEQWSDVDPDAVVPPDRSFADPAPVGAFGTGSGPGEDLGYGAGAGSSPPGDPGAPDHRVPDHGAPDHGAPDHGTYDLDDPDDTGAGFPAEGPDDGGHDPDDGARAGADPHDDPGPPLLGGA